MAKTEDVGLKIELEATADGYYIKINSPKNGTSEYMGMSYDLPYFISVLNIMLDRSVLLGGKDMRVH